MKDKTIYKFIYFNISTDTTGSVYCAKNKTVAQAKKDCKSWCKEYGFTKMRLGQKFS